MRIWESNTRHPPDLWKHYQLVHDDQKGGKTGRPGVYSLLRCYYSGAIHSAGLRGTASGTRPSTTYCKLRCNKRGREIASAYVELSALLNTLCEKGLEVTAVLDCRHALPHDFRSSRSDHSLLEPNELKAMSYGKIRHHFPDTWMRDPVQQGLYTLISSFDYSNGCPCKNWADGRQEYEAVDGATKEKRGFLTSWLLNALHKSQMQVDFKQLLQLMKSLARDLDGMEWPGRRGHKMLAGNVSRIFPRGACLKDLSRIPPAHASRLRWAV